MIYDLCDIRFTVLERHCWVLVGLALCIVDTPLNCSCITDDT